MATEYVKGSTVMKKKLLSISSKRQITIPQRFFTLLGFGSEAECIVRGNELILRPVKPGSGGEFAEQILAELIAEGLSGEKLLEQFKIKQAKVRPAVEKMLIEADSIADGKSDYASFDDIFGTEE